MSVSLAFFDASRLMFVSCVLVGHVVDLTCSIGDWSWRKLKLREEQKHFACLQAWLLCSAAQSNTAACANILVFQEQDIRKTHEEAMLEAARPVDAEAEAPRAFEIGVRMVVSSRLLFRQEYLSSVLIMTLTSTSGGSESDSVFVRARASERMFANACGCVRITMCA